MLSERKVRSGEVRGAKRGTPAAKNLVASATASAAATIPPGRLSVKTPGRSNT